MIDMKTNWKKNTALFIGGQTITLLGSMIVQYAIFWHIMLETKSGIMMTVITIVGFFPMFLISPFGGVWADRFNRKLLINISDGVIAFVSLIVAILLMAGYNRLGILLAVSATRALGQGVQMPAVGAAIPQIVPKKHLTKINGIQNSVQSFCSLSAPMISGALMSFFPLETFFFIDVITAAIGISILMFFVKVPNLKKKEEKTTEIGYFHDLIDGLRYIKRHDFVLRFIVFYTVFMILAAPVAYLTPLQLVRNFGDEVWRLSVMESAFSAGMILGGILIALWGGFKNKIFTIVFSTFFAGVTTIILGNVLNYWLYIAIVLFWGLTIPLFNAPVMVLIQTSVEHKFMGRVMSVFTMVQSSMMPLAMLIFGPLADKVSIDIILIATGIPITLLSFSLLSSKTLRKTGKIDE